MVASLLEPLATAPCYSPLLQPLATAPCYSPLLQPLATAPCYTCSVWSGPCSSTACREWAALKICCCVSEEKSITRGSDSAATKR